jgi:hypothetical protein
MGRLIGVVAGIAVFISSLSELAADEGRHRGGGGGDVTSATNPGYVKECGSCHMAYQAGLLPARSWRRVMAGLADHFGDNAELSPEEKMAIGEYLERNAADSSRFRRSGKIMSSTGSQETPLRITETHYIAGKHRKIPARAISGNPKVRSLSRCSACHTRAETGSYNEHEVEIPGYGRWEDD